MAVYIEFKEVRQLTRSQRPGALLFEPTHQERVLDALEDYSKAHSGDKRRKRVSGHRQQRFNAVRSRDGRRNKSYL